jgi:hypothetical protein
LTYREHLITYGLLIPVGTPRPDRGRRVFRTDFAGQRSAALGILEWESPSVVRAVATSTSTDPVVRAIVRRALPREAA